MTDFQPRVPRLLGDSLLLSAYKQPSKIAIAVGDDSYTYQQLLQHATALANGLKNAGLQPGDHVAIYLDNSWASIFSLYGVMLAGGVFVVVNPQTKADKLAYILEDSEAAYLLTDSVLKAHFVPAISQQPKLRGVIYQGKALTLTSTIPIEHFDDVLGKSDATCLAPTARIGTNLAALIYTSGSTGAPKGVMQTHQSMRFALDSLVEYLRLSEQDRILNVLPFAFDYGLYQLLMTVHLGATLILEKSFAFPAAIYKRLQDREVTVFPAVPTMFSMLLSSHGRKPLCFPSVTRVTNTAAALPADFVSTLKEIFPRSLIYKMYGLTECKRVSYLEPELVDKYPSSVGCAIPGTEVFLLSPEGQPVLPGEAGILHVRGPHIMLGYWKQQALTEKMLKSDIHPNQKALCTHDWFKMDDNGLLYFVGRSDDIIKTKGEKVSPLEVENVICSIEGVNEVAVIGVSDAELGQSIKAFVSLENGSQLDEKKIKRVCASKLENYMLPKDIVILDCLPKTSNGKIDKKSLN